MQPIHARNSPPTLPKNSSRRLLARKSLDGNEHHQPRRRQTVLLLWRLRLWVNDRDVTRWFHFAYVGIDSKAKPEGGWFFKVGKLGEGGTKDYGRNDDGGGGGKKLAGRGAGGLEQGTGVKFPSRFPVTIMNRIFSLLNGLKLPLIAFLFHLLAIVY